ncbi:cell division protein FtsL [Sansalvadorimonas sp. 2012CJ34-2]|uniref:Cell division protein FtsL n=1 Tax=Parendozoicomonas callyspongiae TaxID=2942213 RepID=A0ABT0PC65_9GAMM|nr:cell division protein FtsL [Sansalvadorimonas sp. 2012CJ34-2]MCL6268977.1 cell division protein FtsL [Sansalvadorimonas sp. 2012CJ34-2]
MSGRWLDFAPLQFLQGGIRWLPVVLGALVVVSAFAVVWSAHLNRVAFDQLQIELMRKNAIQEQWGQLLIQHSTLTAHKRIDKLAREQLEMEAPGKDRIIMVQP